MKKYEPVDWFNEWHTYISNLSEKELKERYGEGEYGKERTEYEAYKGYEVAYNNQPKIDKDSYFKVETVEICSAIKDEDNPEVAKALETIIDYEAKTDEIEFEGSLEERQKQFKYPQEYIDAYKLIYSELYDNVTITVTAHYKDGSTGTQTLQLKADFDIDSEELPVSAKIV